MLNALKFVQGAVAKKDFVPSLTHFCIRNRSVLGFNGSLGLSSPIDVDFEVFPRAEQFVKAIAACSETIALHIDEKSKKLVVRSGTFRTFVDCHTTDSYPQIQPEGESVKLDKSLLPALKHLEPFIAEDASRPWACGVLFDGESAYSTNNIVLLQYWLGYKFPCRVNIPANAVRELLRIGEDPVSLQMTERRLVFHYSDGRWLSTQVIDRPWPDVSTIFDKLSGAQLWPFTNEFFEALAKLEPFADDLKKCYMLGDRISTVPDPSVGGASIKIAAPMTGCYNIKQLMNLQGVVDAAGFDTYPAPAAIFGKVSRGIIVGFRA